MILNMFYLLFKCFVRAISNLTEKEQKPDLDVFDIIHRNRFLLFSIVDLLNGLSVLYFFYCMADLSTNHKKKVKPVSLASSKISHGGSKKSRSKNKRGGDGNNSETVNTIKI